MILVDAGPIIALFDRRDGDHQRCLDAAASIDEPLATTWPAIAESMHVLFARLGKPRFGDARESLWNLVETGQLILLDLTGDETRRAADLMRKYADLPMDLADATLVAIAELRGMKTIFTLDQHFKVYRIHGRRALRIVPTRAR